MKALLRVREVAAILNCSVRQVQRYLRSGELCGVIHGRERWITREDLTTFKGKREALAQGSQAPLVSPEPNMRDSARVSAPEPSPANSLITPAPEAVHRTVEGGPCVSAELNEWPTPKLEAAVIEWQKADDLNGVPTCVPAIGSSNMPSPENSRRCAEAAAILEFRKHRGENVKTHEYDEDFAI